MHNPELQGNGQYHHVSAKAAKLDFYKIVISHRQQPPNKNVSGPLGLFTVGIDRAK